MQGGLSAAQESVVSPAPRRHARPLETTVVDVVREARDAVTLVLATAEPAEYAAGQFLTIDPHQFEELHDLIAYFEDVKGRREPPRPYSMSSSPLEPHVAITLKEERFVLGVTRYPPILSPFLARHAAVGQRIRVTGFAGTYVLPRDLDAQSQHVVHVVAGSGSVPSYAIVKHALQAHPSLRHTFLYSSQTWEDVIFRDGLTELATRFPDRLRVVHTLTREAVEVDRGPSVRRGRIGAELLRELIPDPTDCLVYACGPAIGPFERAAARERGEVPAPRFLEGVRAALDQIGVPRERVKTEAYG